MSNLKYAIVEEEVVVPEAAPRPYLVSPTQEQDGWFTRRVESALETDFANGSMPA